MADNLDFACPRCGKSPKRGKFLGSKIWHDDCLIEDLIEKFQNGTARGEIEKILKRVKDKGIDQKVGLGCGWPEFQPKKTEKELEEEYQAELEAAKEKEIKASEEETAKKEEKVAPEAQANDKSGKKEEKASDNKPEENTPSKAPITPMDHPTPISPELTQQSSALKPNLAMNQQLTPQINIPTINPMQNVVDQPKFMYTQKSLLKSPAPTDPTIRNITISAMHLCLKQMKKDIEYGKLLFKMIKEFDWKKEDSEVSKFSEENLDNENDKKENESTEEEDLRPFIVEP